MTEKASLVYSSDLGRVCPECQKAVTACVCKDLQAQSLLGNGKVKIKKDTKSRNGKVVTVVSGLALTEAELGKLLLELKTRCGAGGAVKDGTIEIQGDHCDTIAKELSKRGHKF